MNVLVVYAHPNPKSFNAAILSQIERGLKDGGHTVTVIDLYEANFNPVLIVNEQKKRSDMKNDPETAEYRNIISRANHVIFIYPIWWNGVPAVMKGFFDKVLSSGFAYSYKGILPKGLLKGKSAWVFYTIDSPRWFMRLFRHSAEWTPVGKATLKFCGFRPVTRFVFYGVRMSNESKRKKWLNHVYHQARYKLSHR